ncbi:hypothetical protein QLQ15_17695 [Lysobacter sp. LF1]|uniref:Uncharacterized protein n=1 Tax=Lysobacter stagni TaxID=3045172 RepID=A0ABT6XLW6_9GAMM|nr:hypothetical protein [Lysobacter sp. LF1]MDI9240740.1 hypothetical protein [Lysobacter sp. LF1]
MNRVWANRPNPLSQEPTALADDYQELPAILIYTRSERSEIFDESPRRYRRRVELVIEAAQDLRDLNSLDDELDAFGLSVEQRVLLDETLGGIANDTEMNGSTLTISDAGDRLIGAVVLTFTVEYFTHAPDPDVFEADDLTEIATDYSLANEQPDPRDRARTRLRFSEEEPTP